MVVTSCDIGFEGSIDMGQLDTVQPLGAHPTSLPSQEHGLRVLAPKVSKAGPLRGSGGLEYDVPYGSELRSTRSAHFGVWGCQGCAGRKTAGEESLLHKMHEGSLLSCCSEVIGYIYPSDIATFCTFGNELTSAILGLTTIYIGWIKRPRFICHAPMRHQSKRTKREFLVLSNMPSLTATVQCFWMVTVAHNQG